jgi:rare lipoprotein A
MKLDWSTLLIVSLWLLLSYLGLRWVIRKSDAVFSAPGELRGKASFYGEGYRGKTMANGQPFDPEAMTCAAMLWPLGSLLRVQCVESGTSVVVELTDRGPEAWTNCLIDLSARAFRRICDPRRGHVQVRVTVLREGPESAAKS